MYFLFFLIFAVNIGNIYVNDVPEHFPLFKCFKTLPFTGMKMTILSIVHKKTFLYLEQLILKHKMEKKAINIEEMPEGVDFFFSSKHDGGVFAEFIASQIPAKIKISKHVVSHSNQQHIFIVDIAPVWKNDLIFLSSSVSERDSVVRLTVVTLSFTTSFFVAITILLLIN